MFIKELIEFGLSDKEARVYLALLELEIAGVQEIAKVADVNRSTAYVTLESLKKRGFVSISDEKNVRQYIATPPDAILRVARDKAHQQEHVLEKIEQIVPEMKALFKGTKKKPIVKIFEGKEGLISAFEDTLKCKEKLIRVSSAIGNLKKIIPEYLAEYIKKRYESGIKMKGIHPNDSDIKYLISISPKNFDQPITIPINKSSFLADLAVYDNKIGYMSHKNGGLAILIESKEIADVMKDIFDLAFEEAKRLNKMID
jgi:sugar-specific transcriptional regulator TrmB